MKIRRVEMDLESYSILIHFYNERDVTIAYNRMVTESAADAQRELDSRLTALIRQGSIIEAIKARRAVTSEGLKEAKDCIDKLRERLA